MNFGNSGMSGRGAANILSQLGGNTPTSLDYRRTNPEQLNDEVNRQRNRNNSSNRVQQQSCGLTPLGAAVMTPLAIAGMAANPEMMPLAMTGLGLGMMGFSSDFLLSRV